MQPGPEKHLTYFKLVDFVKMGKCPLCLAELSSRNAYFEEVVDNVNDPGVRYTLMASRGFCTRHSRRFLKAGFAVDRALLYQDQLKLFLEFMEKSFDQDRPEAAPLSASWSTSKSCPACRIEEATQERYLEVLKDYLLDDDFYRILKKGSGFCIPHFLNVAGQVRGEAARRLVACQKESTQALLHELEEFCRKQDYRYARESLGKETDSWRRAIETVAGFVTEKDLVVDQSDRQKNVKRLKQGEIKRLHGPELKKRRKKMKHTT